MTDTQTIPAAERGDRLDGPIHAYFGLTYSNYLVLHRSLMQSMPVEWQVRAVALFRELNAAFAGVERPECFDVQPAREAYYEELTNTELAELGVEVFFNPVDGDPAKYVDRCLDPVTCRLRAQGQGTWKRYP